MLGLSRSKATLLFSCCRVFLFVWGIWEVGGWGGGGGGGGRRELMKQIFKYLFSYKY